MQGTYPGVSLRVGRKRLENKEVTDEALGQSTAGGVEANLTSRSCNPRRNKASKEGL